MAKELAKHSIRLTPKGFKVLGDLVGRLHYTKAYMMERALSDFQARLNAEGGTTSLVSLAAAEGRKGK